MGVYRTAADIPADLRAGAVTAHAAARATADAVNDASWSSGYLRRVAYASNGLVYQWIHRS